VRIRRSFGGTAFVELPLIILMIGSFVAGVALLSPRVGWWAFLLALVVPGLIFCAVPPIPRAQQTQVAATDLHASGM